MAKLLKIYFSMYSLGILVLLVLYLALFSPVSGDRIFLQLGGDDVQERALGNKFSFIQNVQASELEEKPVIIRGENFDRGEGQVIYLYPKFQMTIVELTNVDMDYFYYRENPPKISDIGSANSCGVTINASYFSGTKLDATHVGLLSIAGEQYVPLGVERQLSHVAVFNKQSRTVEFFDASKYAQHAEKNSIEFQTGPLVLDNAQVQTDFISNSKNGMYAHKRLLLATDKSKKIFVIVVREKADLYELGEYLQTLDIFDEELDVINLDGGKSIALWDRDNPSINYNSNDRLPLVLCFK